MEYTDEILELYEEHPNYGKLKDKTHTLKHTNPTCGDEIVLELKIKNGKIVDAKYKNKKNCFVTIVSASALTEKIKGMKLKDALKLTKEDLDKLLNTKIIETRIKCELLPLEALKKINEDTKN